MVSRRPVFFAQSSVLRTQSLSALTPDTLGLKIMPTIRQKIISLLIEEEMSALDISGEVGIPEKEVIEHLVHIARTVASQNKKVILTPAECMGCGYVFADRMRFTRPGRCPQCKKSHIQSLRFRIG
jgi:transcriptional regulator